MTVNLGLGGHDRVEDLARAVLLARLGVGLRDGEGLAERAAPGRGGDDRARGRWSLQDGVPLLFGEITLACHRSLLSLGWIGQPRTVVSRVANITADLDGALVERRQELGRGAAATARRPRRR